MFNIDCSRESFFVSNSKNVQSSTFSSLYLTPTYSKMLTFEQAYDKTDFGTQENFLCSTFARIGQSCYPKPYHNVIDRKSKRDQFFLAHLSYISSIRGTVPKKEGQVEIDRNLGNTSGPVWNHQTLIPFRLFAIKRCVLLT